MPSNDAPAVPVHTWLRTSTYRQLAAHGAQRGLTVPELLSRLADASLKPVKQKHTRITPHMLADARRRLAKESLSDIAADHGVSRAGLRKALLRKDAS